jgi:hypothetical protein
MEAEAAAAPAAEGADAAAAAAAAAPPQMEKKVRVKKTPLTVTSTGERGCDVGPAWGGVRWSGVQAALSHGCTSFKHCNTSHY